MNEETQEVTAQEAAAAAGKGCGLLVLLIVVPLLLALASTLAPLDELHEQHRIEHSHTTAR